jgi:hypothetical protein
MSANTFEMGFVKAISLLESVRQDPPNDSMILEVEWINLDDFEGMHPDSLDLDTRFSHFDLLLVKSNWEWTVDNFVRHYLRQEICSVPKILLISGVHPPPTDR